MSAAASSSPESFSPEKIGQLCLWSLSFLVCTSGERGLPRVLLALTQFQSTVREPGQGPATTARHAHPAL